MLNYNIKMSNTLIDIFKSVYLIAIFYLKPPIKILLLYGARITP
jgi:hypothetical protein